MKHHRINNQTSACLTRASGEAVPKHPRRWLGLNGKKVIDDVPRRGFLLIELIVAMILLGTVAAVLPVTLNAVYKQRQQERFERLAQLELSNIITRMRIDDAHRQLSDWF